MTARLDTAGRLGAGLVVGALALLAVAAGTAPARAGAQASSARITLTVDKHRLSVGDTVDVQIRAEVSGDPIRGIDPPAFDGFDVVGRSTHQPRQFTFRFGGRIQLFESTTVEVFRLRAREAGRFEIGPAVLRTDDREVRSDVVRIEVEPGAGGLSRLPGDDGTQDAVPAAGADLAAAYDPVAFVHTATRPARPVVGEQVTVDVLLYVAERLRHSPTVIREPTADGFWVHDLRDRTRLGEATAVTIQGRRFHAYLLRRFAAFPLRAGGLTVGPAVVRVQTGGFRGFGAFGRGGEVVERRSAPAQVEVAPLPEAGRPAGVTPDDVAVGTFDLRVALDPTRVEVGEAATLTASVKGTGNLKTVRFALPTIPGVEVLPPETEDRLQVRDDRVGGVREIRWLLVPREPGRHALPTLELTTYDPASERFRTQRGGMTTLLARGAPRPAPEPSPAPEVTPTRDDDGPGFGPLRTESALVRNRTPVSAKPWYPWAAAAPPTLLALAGIVALASRRRADADARDPRRWLREGRRALAEARRAARRGDAPEDVHARVVRALEAALGRALDAPVGGYTRRELGALLRERGVGEGLARRLVDELEQADVARFGAQRIDGPEAEAAARRAGRLLDELGRAALGPAPAEGGR